MSKFTYLPGETLIPSTDGYFLSVCKLINLESAKITLDYTVYGAWITTGQSYGIAYGLHKWKYILFEYK